MYKIFPFGSPIRSVRVTTVDNYQGEENDIIILSLVRNNHQDQIGFLKASNRVCVALSRAKQGLYIFGNAECLRNATDKQYKAKGGEVERQEHIWIKVIKRLAARNCIGNML